MLRNGKMYSTLFDSVLLYSIEFVKNELTTVYPTPYVNFVRKYAFMHIKLYFGLTNLNKQLSSFYPEDTSAPSELKERKPPVFLIGAPRSGTTLIYQWITNVLNVEYIDNVTHLFPLNMRFGNSISSALYKGKAHNTYTSYFGRTQHLSMHAPSEGGDFFSLLNQSDFSLRFTNLINEGEGPWVFKNLTLSSSIDRILEICPGAKFIHIKRNVLDTALSIFNARNKLKISDDNWWSAKPKSFELIRDLPLQEKILKQVIDLNGDIETQAQYLNDKQLMTIDYSELQNNEDDLLKRISSFIGNDLMLRKNAQTLVYKESTKPRINHPEYFSFVSALEDLNATNK
jgi:hypothetical protein